MVYKTGGSILGPPREIPLFRFVCEPGTSEYLPVTPLPSLSSSLLFYLPSSLPFFPFSPAKGGQGGLGGTSTVGIVVLRRFDLGCREASGRREWRPRPSKSSEDIFVGDGWVVWTNR